MSDQEGAPQVILWYPSDIGSWDETEVYDPELHGLEVLFGVGGETFAIPERSATVLAENLRRKAAGQLGTEGVEGALALADAIEDVLVGRSEEPIPVEGLVLEAAFCVLDVTMHWAMADPAKWPQDVALFRAIIELHKEQTAGG
ncbi:MAG: hypothetical protein WKF65_07645 [Gaiellaceae bacterium]